MPPMGEKVCQQFCGDYFHLGRWKEGEERYPGNAEVKVMQDGGIQVVHLQGDAPGQ